MPVQDMSHAICSVLAYNTNLHDKSLETDFFKCICLISIELEVVVKDEAVLHVTWHLNSDCCCTWNKFNKISILGGIHKLRHVIMTQKYPPSPSVTLKVVVYLHLHKECHKSTNPLHVWRHLWMSPNKKMFIRLRFGKLSLFDLSCCIFPPTFGYKN